MTEGLVEGPIQVRVGLHTGTPRLGAEGYVGSDVHFGARVAASAHGGQVVLSQSTRELVDGDALTDLGEHRLKDIEHAVAIFQLGGESFPPLKTISNTNLPRPASSFVGREAELAHVLARIEQGARLLTLTGPGGSGKTRLALEAASTLVPEYKAGVFWVGLAALRDSALVAETISQTLGANDGLAKHIGEREMMLLLDNLEQVIEAASELASLLEACPNLTLLCTSRELLRVRGEVEYPVLPLASPEAVALFCERAQLHPSREIAELCAQLDNLPLAVELAAARTKALTVAQILERISQRLDLLKGGRDADPRQQTLRATIEWSHDLLSAEERRGFRVLSVFAGGCTIEAAEEVAEADLDTLQSLVEKSLLRFSEGRYWMLETIREYAAERLEESGEAEEVRRGHADFFLKLAESANMSSEALERTGSRDEVVISEKDNVRAAIDGAIAVGAGDVAGELVVALELFWAIQSPLEGMARAEAALKLSPRPHLRARLMRTYGSSADPAGEHEAAERAYRESLLIFRELADEPAVAHMLMRLGASALWRDDLDDAERLLEESLVRSRGTTKSQVLTFLATIAWERGRAEVAIERLRDSLTLVRKTGFTWWEINTALQLALYLLRLDRDEESEQLARGAVSLARNIAARKDCVVGLAELAVVSARRGELRRAGRLWGAVEAEEARGPLGPWPRDEMERWVFGEPTKELERAAAAGRSLSLDAAVDYALSSLKTA